MGLGQICSKGLQNEVLGKQLSLGSLGILGDVTPAGTSGWQSKSSECICWGIVEF